MKYIFAVIIVACFIALSVYLNKQLHKNLEQFDLYKKIYDYHKQTFNLMKPSYWYKSLTKKPCSNNTNSNNNINSNINLNDFINKVQSVCRQRGITPNIEKSYKITDNGMNNNRCILEIYPLFYTGIIQFIVKNIGFNEKFINFIKQVEKDNKIIQLIVGIDNDTQKIYLTLEDKFLKLDKTKYYDMKCMEISKNIIKYKYYESINIEERINDVMEKIFIKSPGKKLYNLLKKMMNIEERKTGYLRYEIINGNKIPYGFDIPILNNIKNIINDLLVILDITNNYNNWNIDKNTFKTWLDKNKDMRVLWLGVNYRKEKLDFCIYYRNIII